MHDPPIGLRLYTGTLRVYRTIDGAEHWTPFHVWQWEIARGGRQAADKLHTRAIIRRRPERASLLQPSATR